MNNKAEFIALIEALAAAFNREADEALLLAYKIGLEDLQIRDLRRAVRKAIHGCRFMPSVRELRDLAGEVSGEARAVKAWEVFKRAIDQHGRYKSISFDDPLINATAWNLGGWIECCDRAAEHKGETWLRKDFERVYVFLHETGVGSQQSQALIGEHERSNKFQGCEIPEGLELACGMIPVAVESGLPPLLPGTVREIQVREIARPLAIPADMLKRP